MASEPWRFAVRLPRLYPEAYTDGVRPHPIAVLGVALLAPAAHVAQVPLGGGEVLILVGPPGSGKTLQAGKLSRKYKVPSISVPDLLREHLKQGTNVPEYLRASVAAGDLLDDRSAIELVGARIGRPDAARGFILDGYPASEAQAKYLEQFITKNNLKAPIVLVLRAPDQVVRERLRKRRRSMDTPDNIERRMREFHQERTFLETWYTTQNTVSADATGTPDEVFRQVERGLEEVFGRRRLKRR